MTSLCVVIDCLGLLKSTKQENSSDVGGLVIDIFAAEIMDLKRKVTSLYLPGS